MNGGALNAFTLNGSVIDPVVRTTVQANAFALPVSTPRVFAYLKASASPTADVSGAVGRVYAGLSGLSSTAVAEVSGALHRVNARLSVAVQAAADINLRIIFVRAIANLVAAAQATVSPRVFVRSKVGLEAEAGATTVVRPRFKAAVSALGRAAIDYIVTVRPRGYYRVPLNLIGRAATDVFARVAVRFRATPVATADVDVSPRYLVRSPVSSQASADAVFDDLTVIRRIPWDEPAPDERTFRVNPETFVFTVVA